MEEFRLLVARQVHNNASRISVVCIKWNSLTALHALEHMRYEDTL